MTTRTRENPLFQEALKTSYDIGERKRAASPKSVNVSQYKNLPSSTQPTSPQPRSANFGTVTVPYGGSTRYEKFHPGIDIANKIGTPIPASLGGIVREVVTGKKQGDPGYGNYVIVEDKYGGKHRYSHLHNSYVKVGDTVSRGQVVGPMGNTGSTYSLHGGSGSHLDYRIKDMYGRYVNPTQYLSRYK